MFSIMFVSSMFVQVKMLQCRKRSAKLVNYFTWRTDIFPLLGIFTCCIFSEKYIFSSAEKGELIQ